MNWFFVKFEFGCFSSLSFVHEIDFLFHELLFLLCFLPSLYCTLKLWKCFWMKYEKAILVFKVSKKIDLGSYLFDFFFSFSFGYINDTVFDVSNIHSWLHSWQLVRCMCLRKGIRCHGWFISINIFLYVILRTNDINLYRL